MKRLAIYNMKGGVGKTAAAVNLSYAAAQLGARVLVWDLDPQAATTFYFRVKPKVKGGGKGIVGGKRDLDDLIKGTDFEGLDLLPADLSYRRFDQLLDDQTDDDAIFKLVRPLRDDYDFIFFDCPPSLSRLSENIFRAAQSLIIPLVPTTLSLRTYDQVAAFCEKKKVKKLQMSPFFSMVDRRKKLHREIMEAFPKKHTNLLPTPIPYASVIEKMGVERAPVAAFAPRSRAAVAYGSLWQDILDTL
ncbi:MAG: AAA family ATPase [Pseudomonadota bacterium]